jgi:hypothetical protein
MNSESAINDKSISFIWMDIIAQVAIFCQQLGTKEDLGYACVIRAYIPVGLNVIIVVCSTFNECFLFFWMHGNP